MSLALREALLAFRRSPLLSVLGIVTIAFSLFAFGLFSLVALNIRRTLQQVEERVEIRAFVAEGTPVEAVAAAMGDIGAFPEVAHVEYVSPDQALGRARRELGEFSDVFESNLLPGSIELRLKPGHRDPTAVRDVAGRVRSYQFIDDVRYGEEWVSKLYRIRTIASLVGGVLGLAFAAVAVIIIGATIRMAVLARGREISIMRLVGATDGFVRRPFLIDGFVKGVLGGLLALLLSWLASRMISRYFVETVFFDPATATLGVLGGAVIGLLGSALSVGRQLRRAPGLHLGRRADDVPGRSGVRAAGIVLLLAAALLVGLPLSAQQTGTETRLRTQREELDRIRRERGELEQRMSDLQGTVHDLSDEVTNLDRQADATSRAVQALESQLTSINAEVGEASANLVRAEDELVVKRAVLRRRVADIYKRGPLYTLEALLSAESFGALVARYKYLHMLALRDRALVRRVEQLRNQIGGQRRVLVQLQNAMEENRGEKENEEQRLRALEQQRQMSLVVARRTARQTETRLAKIARDEARVTNVIAALEAARRRVEASSPEATTPSTLTTRDLGQLAWPVDGNILYRFGRVVNPNNTTTRWNGIGIGAPAGSPVTAVESGQVVVAEPIGTYGLTVIVQHGGGDYSVYGSLARATVRKGTKVERGEAIGVVGTGDPDLPPHLHFEIRPQGRAVDPLEWLRARR